MTTAACGHPIDFPFAASNVVCKDCFEAQGFAYNENSYRDIRGGAARQGSGTALRASDTREDELARKKRACADILNPHLTSYNVKGARRDPAAMAARKAAFALIKERYGIGRSTASMYALQYRTAA